MVFVDYVVSRDCINIDSYGMICVHCGCCSRNPDYRDMIRKRIEYYKERLVSHQNFSAWDEDERWRAEQEQNVKSSIIYCKQKIRLYKKILRTMERSKG